MVTMKIGFNTCPFIDDAGMPIQAVLEVVAREGYEGVDISATRGSANDPSLFPQEDRRAYVDGAERLGLEIVAVVTHLPMVNAVWSGQPINIPGAIDLAVDVGARMVTVNIGSHLDTSHPYDLAWESAVEHLTDVCKYAESQGLLLAIDGIRPGTLLDTPAKVVQLIGQVGSPILKHNYDPCYLELAGLDPVKAVKELAPHVCHVLARDYKGRYPSFQQHIPGDGKLDYRPWMNALRKMRYRGYVTVEASKEHELKRAARVGMRTVSKFMK
jgi:sugar phosphate isomerase/epimerase